MSERETKDSKKDGGYTFCREDYVREAARFSELASFMGETSSTAFHYRRLSKMLLAASNHMPKREVQP